MKIVKKLSVMLAFVAAATAARFSSMNSIYDLVTPILLSMTLVCGFGYGMIGWALFGVIFELSILSQGYAGMSTLGLIPVPVYFLIELLTMVIIGLAMYGIKALAKTKRFAYVMPLAGGLVKWLLMFGQDFWTLVFKPSSAPMWLAYHLQSEIYALSKIVGGVLWTIPFAIAILLIQYALEARKSVSQVPVGMRLALQ